MRRSGRGAIPSTYESAMLTSRDCVLRALNHEEPDRVSIMLGGSGATSMLVPAQDRLKAHLGIHGETRLSSRIFQHTRPDEEIMARFGSDLRLLLPGPAVSALARELPEATLVNEWGTTWQRQPGVQNYEMVQWLLQHGKVDGLARYP